MKIQHKQKTGGFTLIEIIAVMALTSIGLVFVTMLITTITKVTVSGQNSVEDSQKIQAALNRLVKELTFAKIGILIDDDSQGIQWESSHPDRLGQLGRVTWDGTAGTDLQFSAANQPFVPLLDNVENFGVTFTDNSLRITLSSTTSAGVEHSVVIHPRFDP